jgi:ubiquinone/menaquinone biosynthesis C-methylase UbiE
VFDTAQVIGMDYDNSTISTVYDEARRLSSEGLNLWLDLVSRDAHPVPGCLIVDVGCGTGRFSQPLANRFKARVIGVDPSQKMLEVARRKLQSDRVEFRHAPADSLPLTQGSADIVFMSMVFHHLDDTSAAARDCRRVLDKHGRVCVRNTTREAEFPHRHFFPAIHPLIETMLPTRRDVGDVFEAAGFAQSVHTIVTQVVAGDWSTFVRNSGLRADSFLSRISDGDFEAGMAALRQHAACAHPHEAVVEELDWYVFTKR